MQKLDTLLSSLTRDQLISLVKEAVSQGANVSQSIKQFVHVNIAAGTRSSLTSRDEGLGARSSIGLTCLLPRTTKVRKARELVRFLGLLRPLPPPLRSRRPWCRCRLRRPRLSHPADLLPRLRLALPLLARRYRQHRAEQRRRLRRPVCRRMAPLHLRYSSAR
jgi:hypothetical protein